MRLARLFQKDFLFQQGEALFLWGEATSPSFHLFLEKGGERISPLRVEFESGRFLAVFPPQKGTYEPFFIRYGEASASEALGPIYCGDLYLGVGQSNLAVSLSYMEGKEGALSALKGKGAKILNLFDSSFDADSRVLRPRLPQKEIGPGLKWEKLEGEAALSSSGLLCFLAEKLLNPSFPVGFVNASVGGISIDTLLPESSIEGNPEIKSYLQKTGKYQTEEAWNKLGAANYTQQSGFYNEKIAPLRGLKFKGVVYYQGENSCFDFASGVYFGLALKELIFSYRAYFDSPSLPFYLCGIADEYYPYGDKMGYLYIQEALLSLKEDGVYCIPLFDLEPRWLIEDKRRAYHPIHTVNKAPAAERIAHAMEEVEKGRARFSYPLVEKWESGEGKMKLTLSLEKGDRLQKGKAYFGFTLAEEKGRFHLCHATAVSEREIELSSPYVHNPSRFAYAFTHYSYLCDCRSEKGYPLSPCRSFPGPIDKSEMDLSFIATSFRFLCLRENNFGCSVGGGFPLPLYENGRIIRNPTGKVALEEGMLRFDAVSENSSYYYAGISLLLGPSGLFPRFLGPSCALFEAKSTHGKAEFLGALFRIKGGIYRFPSLGKAEVGEPFQTFAFSLKEVQDGSEGPAYIKEADLDSLSQIELYFRFHEEGRQTLYIRNLRVSDSAPNEDAPKKAKIEDAALSLPGGQK